MPRPIARHTKKVGNRKPGKLRQLARELGVKFVHNKNCQLGSNHRDCPACQDNNK